MAEQFFDKATKSSEFDERYNPCKQLLADTFINRSTADFGNTFEATQKLVDDKVLPACSIEDSIEDSIPTPSERSGYPKL